MKKILLTLFLFNTVHGYKVYELLPSAHEYKIVIKETEKTTIDGYDSEGRISTHSFTQSRELYLKPKDALDLAIRHKNCKILRAALNKLESFNESVNASAALDIINFEMQKARSNKKFGYWISGIISASSILPWLTDVNTKDKLIVSGIINGFAALTAFFNYSNFKQTRKTYKKMVDLILHSPACIIKNEHQLNLSLMNITLFDPN